jgi:phosphoesterase RecJ-like protein
VDHHATNTLFGEVNVVVEQASATCEVLYHLFGRLDVAIDRPAADCLLTGIITDTQSFRTANTTAGTLAAASDLIAAGADLYRITTLALTLKDTPMLLAWRTGLINLKIEDGLFWTAISNAERVQAGHNGSSSFGLGNFLADVHGAVMSAVLVEIADRRVTIGFRCRPPYSVADIALGLGGGGHHLASGCTLEGPLAEVEALVVTRCKESIRRQQALLQAAEAI